MGVYVYTIFGAETELKFLRESDFPSLGFLGFLSSASCESEGAWNFGYSDAGQKLP